MCVLTIDQALYLLKEKSVRDSSAERVKTPSFAKPEVAIGLIGNRFHFTDSADARFLSICFRTVVIATRHSILCCILMTSDCPRAKF